MSTATRAEICIVACAEAFRGDGEILASPMGLIPSLGAKLARATFEPDLLLTDGIASLVRPNAAGQGDTIEGTMPYRKVFDVVWSGRRHVMMGASQIDRFGNQNISCVGAHDQPKVQLLGARGAPGNTINHPTSYWVPRHSKRVFVERVDFVCGVGYDRVAELGIAGRFHEIRRVISNLGVFDFTTAERSMRIASLHPGVSLAEVAQATGFELDHDQEVPTTRVPSEDELTLIRNVLDPLGRSHKEVAA